MAINFNTGPYFDDFDPAKNFYRVLFKPGYAVQARELNQLQSILQHQISSMGNHVFKKNSIVIPGGISLTTAADIVSVVVGEGVLPNLVGKTITNKTNFDYTDDATLTNCITAVVLGYKEATSSTPASLYVKYFKTQDDGRRTFDKSEALKTVDSSLYEFSVDSTVGSTVGKVATISAGTFYTKETFVDVERQSIIVEVDRLTTTNCTIGLNVVESIVTSDNDDTLLDNANGSPNQYAPGADRYKIQLVLTRVDLTTSVDDEKFIKLMDIENNVTTYINNKTQYAELMTTLARRTYDANGNFIVRGLDTTIVESGDSNYVWANVSGGKCYLGGYEYEQPVTTPVAIQKPRDAAHQMQVNPVSTYQSSMTYVYVAGGSYLKEIPNENSLVQFVDTNPIKATFDGSTAPNTSTEVITINSHKFVTGNAVTYLNGGGTSIGGLVSGNTYYIIRVDANSIKLASSLANAQAGTAINLASSGVGSSHSLNKILNVIGYGVFKDIEYALGNTNSSDVYKMFFDYINLEKGYTFSDIGGVKAVKITSVDEGAPVLHQLLLTNLTGSFTAGNTIASTTDDTQSGLMYNVINNYAYVIKNSSKAVPSTSVVKDATTNATATLASSFITNHTTSSYPMIELDNDTIKTLYNEGGDNITTYSIIQRESFTIPSGLSEDTFYVSQALTGDDLYEEYSASDYFAYITDVGYEQFVDLTGLIEVSGNTFTLKVPTGSAMIGRTVWVFSTVNKTNVIEASKTKVTVTAGDTITTPSNSWMALGKQDVIEITKIVDGKTVGIETASWSANVATITTNETHNINNGDVVVVSGVKSTNNSTGTFNSGYNCVATVTGVNAGAKTFTYALTANPGTYSTSTDDVVALPPNINSDTDITNRYVLDAGNTAYLSGTSLIKLKKNATQPRGQIAVQYSYHTIGSGNYISVDSYPHQQDDLEFIGNIADVTGSLGETVQLRRYLDFRVRTSSYFFKNIGVIANASAVLKLRDLNLSHHSSTLVGKYVVGPGFLNGVQISSVAFNADTGNTEITLASSAASSYMGAYYIGLNGTSLSLVDTSTGGGKSFKFPKDNTRIEYQYIKFLPKHVMVYINRTGDLLNVDYQEITGKLDAVKLQRDEFKLPLAYIYMEPYTLTVRNVILEKFENPVYQMLDIHNLKRRIDRNEYYNALALQGVTREISTAGTETTTASRGIWSENIDDIYQQDFMSDDYKCTIYGKNYVAPGTVIRTIPLQHDNTLNTSTWSKTKNTITLPYTETRAFGSGNASRSNNLNPYNVVNWSGKLTLNPSVDNWVDIVSAPASNVSTTITSTPPTVTSTSTAATPVVNVTPISTPIIPPPVVTLPPVVTPVPEPIVEIVTKVDVIKAAWGPDSRGGNHAITFTWETNTGRKGRVNTDTHLSGSLSSVTVGGSLWGSNGEPPQWSTVGFSNAHFDGSYARACINKPYITVLDYLNAGRHFDQKPPSQW